MTPLTPLEYKFIKAGITHLCNPNIPWCPHWVAGKLNNDERNKGVAETPVSAIPGVISSLINKQYIFIDYDDHYRFNPAVTATFKSS